MAQDKKKKVVLKTVEERPKPVVVIRLGPEQEVENVHPPARLGPVKKISEVLQVDEQDPNSHRSSQPNLDDLIHPHIPLNNATEETWGEAKKSDRPSLWGWFALGGAALLGAIIWSLLSVKKSDEVAKTIRHHAAANVVDEAVEQREAENLLNSIESAMRSYFSATSVDSRLRWVRFPGRVEPMMRKYEESVPYKPSAVQTIRVLQPLPIERHTQFWMASIVLASGERRELLIECTDAGPRIDWETMVCYQPMPWDEFAARKTIGTSLDFRLYVEPSSFYSHEFSNEDEWTCYRLRALGAEEVMFGYVRRGTEAEAQMKALTSGIRHASLILRLQIPPALKSPMGVVIENIVSPRWLHITLPEE